MLLLARSVLLLLLLLLLLLRARSLLLLLERAQPCSAPRSCGSRRESVVRAHGLSTISISIGIPVSIAEDHLDRQGKSESKSRRRPPAEEGNPPADEVMGSANS